MFPLPIFHYFEWAAFITSVICYQKIKDKPLRWFIPFLLLMVITETTARYMRYELLVTNNTWLYNIYIPIETLFYIFIFYNYFGNKYLKKITGGLFFVTLLFALYNLAFIQGLYKLNTNFIKYSASLLVVLSICYFVDLFNSPTVIYPLKESMFWIAMGLLFFNLGSLAYNLAFDYILANQKDPRALLFISIKKNLIYILYSCIIISIVIAKKCKIN